MPRLARILIYPVKSFDGVAVEQARVLESGALEHDRRWALVDTEGRFVNGKRTPRMHQLRSTFDLVASRVTLSAEGTQQSFSLESDRVPLEAWLSSFFGLTVRLEENATAGFPDDTDSPGPTVISTATLEAVARWFPGLSIDDVRRRFRANLEIDGIEPFWEDRLYADAGQPVPFQIGAARFEGTNPCQRCVVPTRSPETGERYEDFTVLFEKARYEALPYWATRSRFDHFYRLAVNTRPGTTGRGMIYIGDEVRVT
ncbi:MAG: MOSC N-terminal beta barrel domain-containing protein [Planctomycetia bacterium]|nr:MOSC N-terminal beta barrel domain-containing protein [Planctomycetia bacterium]